MMISTFIVVSVAYQYWKMMRIHWFPVVGERVGGGATLDLLDTVYWHSYSGDMHHLQRLTWLIERTKERTTEQCSQPYKTMQLQVIGVQWKRFKRCMSTAVICFQEGCGYWPIFVWNRLRPFIIVFRNRVMFVLSWLQVCLPLIVFRATKWGGEG